MGMPSNEGKGSGGRDKGNRMTKEAIATGRKKKREKNQYTRTMFTLAAITH